MIKSILKILETFFSYFLSEEKVQERKKKKEEKQDEQNRKDIYSGDSDAVSTRIDKLLRRYNLRKRGSQKSTDKEG